MLSFTDTQRQQSILSDIPTPLRTSRLLKKGGYEVFTGFMTDDFFQHLQAEAFQARATAVASDVAIAEEVKERGGKPERKFLSASGGSYLASFCESPQVLELLQKIVGLPVKPSGPQGTFTYYVNPGDHLALHRDILACDLAVITSLYDNTEQSSLGGVLALYPERYSDALSQILDAPEEKKVLVKLLQGQTLVMLGGIVPHLVLPMNDDEQRIISIVCYQVIC